jgi:hypothetical protein
LEGIRYIMADIKYEITQELGVLSESKSGWTRELNLVSWNGAAPRFDIRDWAPGHEKMGKGISLNGEELAKLKQLLDKVED